MRVPTYFQRLACAYPPTYFQKHSHIHNIPDFSLYQPPRVLALRALTSLSAASCFWRERDRPAGRPPRTANLERVLHFELLYERVLYEERKRVLD